MKTPHWVVLALCLGACAGSSSNAPTDAPLVIDGADVRDALPMAPLPVARAEAPFVRYVDPRIGTGGEGFGTGSAFPGPQRPFGLARPGPDTTDERARAINFAHCAGYADFDEHIAGFSQLHMHGAGIVDYGAIGFMPALGPMTAAKTRAEGYVLPFRHARETMEVGYYAVTFDRDESRVEVTATDHVALYRVTLPRRADGAQLLIDLGHALPDVTITAASVTVDRSANEVTGRVRFSGGYSARFGGVEAFFVARTSASLAEAGTWSDGALSTTTLTRSGVRVGAYVPVDTMAGATVTVAFGLSLTDLEHARANLTAEAPTLDFDRCRREASAQWESLLARQRFEARGERTLRMLYSAVYHTLQMPTLVSDADGSYRAINGRTLRAEGWRYYSDLSLWDTFRTEHPWLSMVYPEYQRDFVRSLVAMGEIVGHLPRWPLGTGDPRGMLGDPGALMIADSWLRGVRDFDVERAYGVARRSALGEPTGREALAEYMALGFVPVEARGASAAATMEYAYADGALAAWARGLGRAEDATLFTQRSHGYRRLWDPAQRFLVGRRRDRSFQMLRATVFWDPVFAEGNAWQYLWYAPHDLAGLADLLGGPSAFNTRLDEFFALSMSTPRTPLPERYYWHGNEPDIHAPWIPSAFGDAARASRYVHWVRTQRYTDGPDGIPGNDDAGTLSAWYVFAALGVYPIAGTEQWLLAAPLVTRAEVQLADGATLTVEAPAAGTAALTPLAMRWGDSDRLARPTLTQAEIARGGRYVVELAP